MRNRISFFSLVTALVTVNVACNQKREFNLQQTWLIQKVDPIDSAKIKYDSRNYAMSTTQIGKQLTFDSDSMITVSGWDHPLQGKYIYNELTNELDIRFEDSIFKYTLKILSDSSIQLVSKDEGIIRTLVKTDNQ